MEGIKCSICHLGVDPKRSIPVRTRFCNHVHCQQCIVPWHKHIESQLPNDLGNYDINDITQQDEDGRGGCPTCRKGASTTKEKHQLRNVVMPLRQFTKIEMMCVGGCKKELSYETPLLFPCGHVTCNQCESGVNLVGKKCPTCNIRVQAIITDHLISEESHDESQEESQEESHGDSQEDFKRIVSHFEASIDNICSEKSPLEFLRSRSSFYDLFDCSKKALHYFLDHENHDLLLCNDDAHSLDCPYPYTGNVSVRNKVYWNIVMHLALNVYMQNGHIPNIFEEFSITRRLFHVFNSIKRESDNFINNLKNIGLDSCIKKDDMKKWMNIPVSTISPSRGWRLYRTNIDQYVKWKAISIPKKNYISPLQNISPMPPMPPMQINNSYLNTTNTCYENGWNLIMYLSNSLIINNLSFHQINAIQEIILQVLKYTYYNETQSENISDEENDDSSESDTDESCESDTDDSGEIVTADGEL
jgi:hypothetical protein